MGTREVVESYYRYASSQNRTRWLGLFDPAVVLEEQIVGRVVGLGALTELIGGLDAAYPAFRAVPELVRALELLQDEVVRCLGLLGVTSHAELSPSFLAPVAPLGRSWLHSAFPLLQEEY